MSGRRSDNDSWRGYFATPEIYIYYNIHTILLQEYKEILNVYVQVLGNGFMRAEIRILTFQ